MKKPWFILLLVIFISTYSPNSLGQMIVSDPTMAGLTAANKATIAKQLEESARQTFQLKQTYEQLIKVGETYTKVSSTLRNANMVMDLLRKQYDLAVLCGNSIKAVSRQKTASTNNLNLFLYNVRDIMENNRQCVSLMKEILNDGDLKGNDTERLKLIMDFDARTEAAMKKIRSYRTAYEGTNYMINFVKKNF